MANVDDIRSWAGKKGAGPTGAGEGSRGGHIIGHTKSGIPIYASAGYKSAQQLVGHVEEHHTKMNAADHQEAAGMHREAAKAAEKGSPERAQHEAHALAHEMVGANKALATHFGGSAAGGLAHGMDHSAPAAGAGGSIHPNNDAYNHGPNGFAHRAREATAAAQSSGTGEAHIQAAEAHKAAHDFYKSKGDDTKAREHLQAAAGHQQAAMKAGSSKPAPDDSHANSGVLAPNKKAMADRAEAQKSKVREKLGGSGSGALDFGPHTDAKKSYEKAKAHAANGDLKSAATNASAAADRVTRNMAMSDIGAKDHALAAHLHDMASKMNGAVTKPQTAHVHTQLAAAHRLGEKAEKTSDPKDHDAASRAFEEADQTRLSGMHHQKASAGSRPHPR